jgi:hypothetical protein
MRKMFMLPAILGLGVFVCTSQSVNAFEWSDLNPAYWGHCPKCEKKKENCSCKKKKTPCQKEEQVTGGASPCNPCQKQAPQQCEPCEKLQEMSQ